LTSFLESLGYGPRRKRVLSVEDWAEKRVRLASSAMSAEVVDGKAVYVLRRDDIFAVEFGFLKQSRLSMLPVRRVW
jgi:hypothetical protein